MRSPITDMANVLLLLRDIVKLTISFFLSGGNIYPTGNTIISDAVVTTMLVICCPLLYSAVVVLLEKVYRYNTCSTT